MIMHSNCPTLYMQCMCKDIVLFPDSPQSVEGGSGYKTSKDIYSWLQYLPVLCICSNFISALAGDIRICKLYSFTCIQLVRKQLAVFTHRYFPQINVSLKCIFGEIPY